MYHLLLCFAYPYQTSQITSSKAVVDGTPVVIMGYPVAIQTMDVSSIPLGTTFDAFNTINLQNSEYKFYVQKSTSDTPEIDTNNAGRTFVPPSLGTYEDPQKRMTYRDIVLSTYVYLGYLDASSFVFKRVHECADTNQDGVLEFRDTLSVTYFYLGYLSEFPK